jgi:hypothetical protein
LHLGDQTQAQEFTRLASYESAAQVQMRGNCPYGDFSVVMEMADRDQNCVLDSRQTNTGGKAIADRFQPCRERKHSVDESAKLAVRGISQQFRPGDCQRLSAGPSLFAG